MDSKDKPTALSEAELDVASGGAEAWPSKCTMQGGIKVASSTPGETTVRGVRGGYSSIEQVGLRIN